MSVYIYGLSLPQLLQMPVSKIYFYYNLWLRHTHHYKIQVKLTQQLPHDPWSRISFKEGQILPHSSRESNSSGRGALSWVLCTYTIQKTWLSNVRCDCAVKYQWHNSWSHTDYFYILWFTIHFELPKPPHAYLIIVWSCIKNLQ